MCYCDGRYANTTKAFVKQNLRVMVDAAVNKKIAEVAGGASLNSESKTSKASVLF